MGNPAPFPSFFIIGVPKAGTTSLCNYLDQHPQIFMPKAKEPNTLFFEYINGEFSGPPDQVQAQERRSMQEYVKLFEGAGEAAAIGESSFYLYSDNARKTLHELVPDAKFIIIFRNPVDRAYSNYLHLRQVGEERIGDFQTALAQEEKRIKQGKRRFWNYKENGLYTEHLKKYFSVFPRHQFYIQLYDNWQSDNKKVLREIFEFLNVDPDVPINTDTRFRVGGTARISALGHFLHNQPPLKTFLERSLQPLLPKSLRYKIWWLLTELNREQAPKLDPIIRRELLEFYCQDILDLQTLIDMDLKNWIENPS